MTNRASEHQSEESLLVTVIAKHTSNMTSTEFGNFVKWANNLIGKHRNSELDNQRLLNRIRGTLVSQDCNPQPLDYSTPIRPIETLTHGGKNVAIRRLMMASISFRNTWQNIYRTIGTRSLQTTVDIHHRTQPVSRH